MKTHCIPLLSCNVCINGKTMCVYRLRFQKQILGAYFHPEEVIRKRSVPDAWDCLWSFTHWVFQPGFVGSRMFDGFLSFIYPFCFDWTCTIYFSHTGINLLILQLSANYLPLLYLLTNNKGFYLIYVKVAKHALWITGLLLKFMVPEIKLLWLDSFSELMLLYSADAVQFNSVLIILYNYYHILYYITCILH